MRLSSYLQSAEEILSRYNGALPFATWLKDYFRQHKKFGSKDRKAVAGLCFCYYRLGTAFTDKSMEERLLLGQFLCADNSPFIIDVKPGWLSAASSSVEEKLSFLGCDAAPEFFPFLTEVSSEIEVKTFNLSHLIQPHLFLRMRPGKKERVLKKLEQSSIKFIVEDSCIRLPNGSKVEEVLAVDADVVIQDKSSQQALDVLQPHLTNNGFMAFDCCAASGGKSILLHDRFPSAQLMVSDVRQSILHNLKSRFSRAGIHRYKAYVADVSAPSYKPDKLYDVVLCDAPCSGSGTWGRTPEQLSFFKKEKLDYYAALQKKIALNAMKAVKPGGLFLYITCSVFSAENEGVVNVIAESGATLIEQRYIEGYTHKADTLFVALFRV